MMLHTRLRFSPLLGALAVALFALLVYLKTLAPTVSFIDSGELATVACTLGIAHPTGYPLFTLLGWLFSRLPVSSEEIVRLNIMAAFFSAVGLFVFFRLVCILLTVAGQARGPKATTSHGLLVGGMGASLFLAFSETYWSQSVSVEVYSLHMLFLSVALYTFVKAVSFRMVGGGHDADQADRWWMLFAFVIGLAFTNHMTTILLAPGVLYLYFSVYGVRGMRWRQIVYIALAFFAGLSLYIYLPVRGSQFPILSWGDPTTFERFVWHLSGKQYRVWIFSSTEAAGRQLAYFIDSLPAEFTPVALVAAGSGLVILMRAHARLAVTSVILFVTCVLYSINYDIHDIDSYFLLAYFVIALWSGCAFYSLYDVLTSRVRLHKGVAGMLLLGISLLPLTLSYSERDESRNYLVEDYTKNMFNSFEQNALVLSYQWDYWVSASYYYQYVRQMRTDLTVVDKELLRRSWYLKELERRYPWLIESAKVEISEFLKELEKFEHDIPYSPQTIQRKFVRMIKVMIEKSLPTRPVYVTAEIEPEFTSGLQRVPWGLAERLFQDSTFHPSAPRDFEYRPFERKGRLEGRIKSLYVDALVQRGVYYYSQGANPKEARNALSRALLFDPTSAGARHWLRIVGGSD